MAYPSGVITRQVSVGGAVTIEGEENLGLVITTVASRSLVWVANGWRLESLANTRQTLAAGEEIVFTLPVTDQNGYLDAETRQAIIVGTDEASHLYTTTLEVYNGSAKVREYIIGPYAVPQGAGVLDLDTLNPNLDPISGTLTTYIPGRDGTLTPEFIQLRDDTVQAAADAVSARDQAEVFAANTVELQDEAVAALVADEDSMLTTELSARYVDAEVTTSGRLSSDSLDAAYSRASVPSPRLVLAGDSLTDYEEESTSTGSYYSVRGPWTWALVMLGQRLNIVKNAGIAGNTSTQLLARYDADVIAHNPAVVSLMIGTNDVSGSIPAATTHNNILEMIGKNRRAGALTILRTIPPQDADDSAKKNARIRLNTWLRSLNAMPDVVVIDVMPLVVDPVTGNFDAGTTYDGIHFEALGAYRIGKQLAEVLRPLLPAWDRLPSSPSDPDNYLPNGWMVGDTSPYHNATGWTFSGSGVTLSKVPRTDGVNGEWQQVVATTADASNRMNRTITLGGDLVAGDTVQCFAEFETDAAAWASVSQFHLVAIAKNVGTPTWYAYSTFSQGAIDWASGSPRIERGVFATPRFVIPAGSTVVEIRLVFNGVGTVRWGRSSLVKA